MSHNSNPQLPPDDVQVNLENPRDVEFWCREFGVTPQRLRELVAHVGVLADDVRRAAPRQAPDMN